MIKRLYLPSINEYLGRKIAIITGPRQVGKTTIAQGLNKSNQYINFDLAEHRTILKDKSWDRKKSLIIFDEIHKMRKWKAWLKGVYDTEKQLNSFVVTGSANFDTYKKVGDSLAGRYFHYRIHPLDLKELNLVKYKMKPDEVLDRLMAVGGFPEPFFEGSKKFYNLWSRTHLDIILKQDLIDLESVRDIKTIEILIDLLTKKVGSPISYNSLAEDLQVTDKTIKKWLTILENMYVIFKLTPFHKNIARSNLKQPKYYFYDIARVKDEAARLENLVACSLLKECHYRQDCLGEKAELFYLSKRGGLEIDFLMTQDSKPVSMIEVKTSDDQPSKNFKLFQADLKDVKKIQVVRNLKQDKTFPDGLEIRKLADYLTNL
jgi:uncharacterized protein